MLTAERKERLTSLAGVLLLHLLIGWAMLLSFAPAFVRGASNSLDVFNVPQAPPPPLNEPERARGPDRRPAPAEPDEEAASRPNAAQAAVAVPKAVRDVPPPVAAGLVPAEGGETSRIADRPGSGGGGSGQASGSDTSGSGAGGGGTGGSGDGGPVTRAELRSGRITRSDYPRDANEHQGLVEARLTVSAAGAVTGCRITRSSGNAVLDAATCRLIRERFRYAPARDAQGNAVPDVKGWQQRWWRD